MERFLRNERDFRKLTRERKGRTEELEPSSLPLFTPSALFGSSLKLGGVFPLRKCLRANK